MWNLLAVIASTFGVIFVAELGDKTQLFALGFGARQGLRTVFVGLLVGYAAAGALATIVGALVGSAFPDRSIAIVAGVVFLVVAAFTLVDSDPPDAVADHGAPGDPPGPSTDRRVRQVVGSIAITIALAEMGDKTQLATAALAARSDPVATWIGATAGEVTAGMVGALAGQRIGRRVDARALRIASAGLFAVFGVVLLVTAW